jgi:hypothetical protein
MTPRAKIMLALRTMSIFAATMLLQIVAADLNVESRDFLPLTQGVGVETPGLSAIRK